MPFPKKSVDNIEHVAQTADDGWMHAPVSDEITHRESAPVNVIPCF